MGTPEELAENCRVGSSGKAFSELGRKKHAFRRLCAILHKNNGNDQLEGVYEGATEDDIGYAFAPTELSCNIERDPKLIDFFQ